MSVNISKPGAGDALAAGLNIVGASDSNTPRVFTPFTYQKKPLPTDLQGEINGTNKVGASIFIINPESGNLLYATNNFYLTSMQFSYQEKAQVLETFGSSVVSFFGQKTVVYQFQGMTTEWLSQSVRYKTMQNSSLVKLYSEHLRASQLAKDKNIAVLKVFNHSIWGYPLSLNTSHQAAADGVAPFGMSWVVVKHKLDMPGTFTESDLAKLYSTDGIAVDSQTLALRAVSDSIAKLTKVPYGDSNKINMFGTTPQLWKALVAENDTNFNRELPLIVEEVHASIKNTLTDQTNLPSIPAYIEKYRNSPDTGLADAESLKNFAEWIDDVRAVRSSILQKLIQTVQL